eukprot:TRINITY_DN12336_c0_g1_i1.p1 TRINITY_DN12336_c0_g1~~TRINITY_DN12336_c0_g1_i1.p1  ORF type:complete len:650 (+),score=175.62 TRINITY_DN12336_c0_g1_i1:189-1952(+)
MDGMDVTPFGGYQWWERFHQKGAFQIRRLLRLVNCVVEIRDARAPFTTYNEELEKMVIEKPRIIVFNKAEMADPESNRRLKEFYKKLGVPVMLTTRAGLEGEDARKLAEKILHLNIPTYHSTAPINTLVIGMPKVGKSAILHRLRKTFADDMTNVEGIRLKHAKRILRRHQGSSSYITRLTRTIGTVKIPTKAGREIVLYDTPGFLFPRCTNLRQGKKIAILGMSELQEQQGYAHLYEVSKMVFNTLFMHGMEASVMAHFRLPLPPPKNLEEFQVRAVATTNSLMAQTRRGMKFMNPEQFVYALKEPYNAEVLRVLRMLVDHFRNGRFGRITIDEIPSINEDNVVTAPPYIREMFQQEQDARDQRAKILHHIQKTQATVGKTVREKNVPEGADDAEATIVEQRLKEKKGPSPADSTTAQHVGRWEVQGTRVWDVLGRTVDTARTGPYSTENERHKVGEILQNLRNNNQPLTRQPVKGAPVGVLQTDLSEFQWTPIERSRVEKRNRIEDQGNAYTAEFVKTKDRNARDSHQQVMPKTPRVVRIRRYATPNALNTFKGVSAMTGEEKTANERSSAFREQADKIRRRSVS